MRTRWRESVKLKPRRLAPETKRRCRRPEDAGIAAFSPNVATSETEELRVELAAVTTLELTIVPDQRRGEAHACLAQWGLA